MTTAATTPTTTPAARSSIATAPFLAIRLRRLDAELPKESRRVLGGSDDEAVHDLRVTIRRLRTILKLARPVFGRFHADAVRAAFAAAQAATGNLRDEEALEETLAELNIDDIAFHAWLKNRRTRRRALHRAVVTTLQRGDFRKARQMLNALLMLPAEPNKSSDLGKFARKCVDNARNFVDRHRDAKATDVEGLHELRIAYKGLRYTVETFSDVLPADLKALREPAVKMQKLLGEVHDVDVALQIIDRARGLNVAVRDRVQNALISRRAAKISEFTLAMHPEPAIEEPAVVVTPKKPRAQRAKISSSVPNHS